MGVFPLCLMKKRKEKMMLTWHRFAAIINEPDGQRLMNALWEETMAELSFAGVKEILGSLGK